MSPERARAWSLDGAEVQRLYRDAKADRWQLPLEPFAALLELSVRRAFLDQSPDQRAVARYLQSLHLEDVALACACAEGLETAWDHFVREYRPVLYRAADAIDPSGGARETADSLYGELFGLGPREGSRGSQPAERQSLFRYFHGRSSLGTWLRAIVSQRHVDRVRHESRLVPLPADDDPAPLVAKATASGGALVRTVEIMRQVLAAVVAELAPRDRLRLRCYYAQELTLAQIGRMLGEHEATVSRNLTRTRRAIREQVERTLRERDAMSDAQIEECFAAVLEDAGPLDVADLLGSEVEPAAGARSPNRIVQSKESSLS